MSTWRCDNRITKRAQIQNPSRIWSYLEIFPERMTIRNRKNLNCAIHCPMNPLDIIQARQWPESFETYFKVKTKNIFFNFLKPLRKIMAFFYRYELNSWTAPCTSVAAMMGLQSFSALVELIVKNWNQRKDYNSSKNSTETFSFTAFF